MIYALLAIPLGSYLQPLIIMSAIPLVLAVGPGAESRTVIGLVILAGVLFSALLTLFVVPATYHALAKHTGSPKRLSRILQKLEKQHENQI